MKNCKHREACDPDRGERTPIKNSKGDAVDAHSCRYVDERNRLIPQAEQLAATSPEVLAVMPGPGRDAVHARVFMGIMDRLALDAGLIEGIPGELRAVAAA